MEQPQNGPMHVEFAYSKWSVTRLIHDTITSAQLNLSVRDPKLRCTWCRHTSHCFLLSPRPKHFSLPLAKTETPPNYIIWSKYQFRLCHLVSLATEVVLFDMLPWTPQDEIIWTGNGYYELTQTRTRENVDWETFVLQSATNSLTAASMSTRVSDVTNSC